MLITVMQLAEVVCTGKYTVNARIKSIIRNKAADFRISGNNCSLVSISREEQMPVLPLLWTPMPNCNLNLILT